MIVGDLKPLEEIISAIKGYKQVLVLGCGSCVTVCLSGGEKEAEQLCCELSQIKHYQEPPPQFEVGCIIRQCEKDLVLENQKIPDGTDAILVEFRDVTQVRKLQSELARADHLITLGIMNAGIAHEFKNRLAPLRAFAQMIAFRAPENEYMQRYSPMIMDEIDRLTVLVKDILDYARPQQPHRRCLDLAAMVEDLTDQFVEEFAQVLTEHGVSCEVKVDGPRPSEAMLDPDQLSQVILNIFKNSLDACTASETGERVINIAFADQGSARVLTVQDTGVGMSEDMAKAAFRPFVRGAPAARGGFGVGLTIVKRLSDRFGWPVRIDSEPGVGTRVAVEFPDARCEELPR